MHERIRIAAVTELRELLPAINVNLRPGEGNDCMGDNDTSSRPPEDRGEPGSTRQQGRCLRSYDTEPTVASHVILGVYYRIRVNDM